VPAAMRWEPRWGPRAVFRAPYYALGARGSFLATGSWKEAIRSNTRRASRSSTTSCSPLGQEHNAFHECHCFCCCCCCCCCCCWRRRRRRLRRTVHCPHPSCPSVSPIQDRRVPGRPIPSWECLSDTQPLPPPPAPHTPWAVCSPLEGREGPLGRAGDACAGVELSAPTPRCLMPRSESAPPRKRPRLGSSSSAAATMPTTPATISR
jgi:hypothetical protein